MYISEWPYQSQNISNIRVTTKVAVHSLLSEAQDLQIRGAAIIHNLACKEVKTVVCIIPLCFFHLITTKPYITFVSRSFTSRRPNHNGILSVSNKKLCNAECLNCIVLLNIYFCF